MICRSPLDSLSIQGVCFTRKSLSDCQSFSLEGRPITWKESKYLGFWLGQHLNINSHVTSTLNKTCSIQARLLPMLSCNSHLIVCTKSQSIFSLYAPYLCMRHPSGLRFYWPPTSVGWSASRQPSFVPRQWRFFLSPPKQWRGCRDATRRDNMHQYYYTQTQFFCKAGLGWRRLGHSLPLGVPKVSY